MAAIEEGRAGHRTWPWQDRQGRFSPLKGVAFAIALSPAAHMGWETATGAYGPSPVPNLLYWSGLWATALLLLALAVTPVRGILRWNRIISVRRTFGVAALGYTVFHVLTYFAFDSWDFGQIAREMAQMTLNIIAATVSTIGLIVLGATSCDACIRRLGPQGWRRLHRTVYWLAFLAVLHFLLSRGNFSHQYLMAGLLFWLMAWRAMARFRRGGDPKSLVGLAILSGLFTMLLEVAWLWMRQAAPPLQTIAFNLDFEFGPSPAVQVFAVGMLAAAAALAVGRSTAGDGRGPSAARPA